MKRMLIVFLAVSIMAPALGLAGPPTRSAKMEMVARVIHDIVNGAATKMPHMITGEKATKTPMIRYVSRQFRGTSFGAPSSLDERCRVNQLVEFGPPFNNYEITFINGPFEEELLVFRRIDENEGQVEFTTEEFGTVTATVYWLAGDCVVEKVRMSK